MEVPFNISFLIFFSDSPMSVMREDICCSNYQIKMRKLGQTSHSYFVL